MTAKAQPGTKAPKALRQGLSRWAPWAALVLVVAFLGVLAWFGPSRLWNMLTTRPAPQAGGPLDLTIVHSNDTWGYVFPCG